MTQPRGRPRKEIEVPEETEPEEFFNFSATNLGMREVYQQENRQRSYSQKEGEENPFADFWERGLNG